MCIIFQNGGRRCIGVRNTFKTILKTHEVKTHTDEYSEFKPRKIKMNFRKIPQNATGNNKVQIAYF